MDRPELSWHFLINPAAAGGRAAKKWQWWLSRLRAELPGLSWAESSSSQSLGQLAAAAVAAGKDHLVGVGGDGTHHQVLNGIVAAGGLGRVTYAPLPLGTGNDWVRTLGTPRRPDAWLRALRGGNTLEHAVGRLAYRPPETPPAIRYFLNVAGLAYDAEVVRRSDDLGYKHRLLYPLLTLAFLRAFRAPTVRIVYDGRSWEGPVHTVNFGIGRYNGGGMRLVPHADPRAPTLALTFARELPLWKILAESWRFYTPTIGRVRGVTLAPATRVAVTPLRGKLEVEADGEWLGYGPVEVSLLPQRLRVIVP